MSKLLSASFIRLRKSIYFWLCIIAISAISVITMLNGCRQATSDAMSMLNYSLDHYYFNLAPMLGIFWTVFSSLYIGTEYSDGVIRNKLIVGRTRTSVYLSNLIVTSAAALIMTAVWLISGLCGIPVLGIWKMPVNELLICLLAYCLTCVALSSLLTACQMSLSNKAVSAVLSVLFVLGLIVCASLLYNTLCEPEMISGVVMTAENGLQMSEPSPNPAYVGGIKRSVYNTLLNILPTGQQILIADQEITNPVIMMLSSVILTVISTLCGIAAFCKKDIK